MTDAAVPEEEVPSKPSKLPMIIGLVLAIAGGGAGYFAASSGLILPAESAAPKMDKDVPSDGKPMKDYAFVPMEPLTISLPSASKHDHLRFRGELEVASAYSEDVKSVMPRIIDVLNSYLRALEVRDIEQAASLKRLRSQMLHRIQIVTGPGRVNDLLIMEFVLN